MASLSVFRYLTAIPLLVLCFRTIYADFNVSFASEGGHKDWNFESMFALYGDAKMGSGGKPLQLSGSAAHSAGRVVYKHPIELLGGTPRQSVPFETKFNFYLSRKEGDGLAFVMAPVGYSVDVFDDGGKSKFLAVEFQTLRDYLNFSIVSVKLGNLSSTNSTLNSGKKLQAWIDYQPDSQFLEVRLAELGKTKPLDPLLSYPLDVSRMWDEPKILLSLTSSQECNLYSWGLKIRTLPHWMHSLPVDLNAASTVKKSQELSPVVEKRDCTFRVLGALVLGIGCGALGALIVLFVWTILGYKRLVVPEDYAEQQAMEKYEYKKAKIVDKPSGKN